MTGTIRIDGNDYPYVMYYDDELLIWRTFNNMYSGLVRDFKTRTGENFDPKNKQHTLAIPNDFHFWVVWKVLVKKGKLRWKKPFRSKKAMIKRIRSDEHQALLDLAGRDILKLKWYEDRESGNAEKCQ